MLVVLRMSFSRTTFVVPIEETFTASVTQAVGMLAGRACRPYAARFDTWALALGGEAPPMA